MSPAATVLTAEADEVNSVISALEKHGISVTAHHSHMLKEDLRLFLHALFGAGQRRVGGGGIKAAGANVSIK